MKAVVIANGELVRPPDIAARLAAVDLVIAADGGSQHCQALKVQPHVIIGDLDSLEADTRAHWENQGVRIISYPADKNQTDLELALIHARQAGAKEIVVLAALGLRLDHSFANLLLAANPQFDDCSILFLHGDQRLLVIRGITTIEAKLGERVSLLPLRGDATSVTTRGLKFPLNDEMLHFGSSRGVSNIVLSNNPEIEIGSGFLLCVISSLDKDN